MCQNKSKINFLEELCDSNSIFIALTESHLNSSIEDSEIQINNFNVTRCDRKDRKGGGVVLYVKSSFTTRALLSYCNTVCEVLIVEVVKPHMFVVLIYRPPDASLSNFLHITNRIETTLLDNNASANDILLLGDFNLPHSNNVHSVKISHFLVI